MKRKAGYPLGIGTVCVRLLSVWLTMWLLSGCGKPSVMPMPAIPEGQWAEGFILREQDGMTEVLIRNPWRREEVMQRCVLVPDSLWENAPKVTDGSLVVKVPIRRMAVTSCTHVGFVDALHENSSLCGVCSPELIYNAVPTEEEGCVDLGDAMQPNIERLLLTHPDALMLSTYAQADALWRNLQRAGIPVICNNEWTERHPLARAEWIRLVGALYGRQAEADSIFQATAERYCTLRDSIARGVREKRTLMAGNNFRGTWYMPGGQVYTAILYTDAGADYKSPDPSSDKSVPLSLESVIRSYRDADVWVGSEARSLSELARTDSRHTWFKAYKDGEVYNFLRRSTSTGANDYWESAVVFPDRLLGDLAQVLYPELLPDREPIYIEKLQKTE